MTTILKSIALAAVLALASPALAAPSVGPSGVTAAAGNDVFAQQVAKAEADDPATDFTALRMAWIPSQARKGRADAFDAQAAMGKALAARNYPAAGDAARKVASSDYTSPRAHFVLYKACQALGDKRCEDHEHWVFLGLMKSVLASGDGKTADTAWKVVSVEEEYVVMDLQGIDVGMQALVFDKGHAFDVLTGKDEKGAEASYYFNIDAFWGHELE